LSVPLEDYALIGDCETAALVSRSGSIDWLCFPRFDSPACFAALLGSPENGHWLIEPAEPVRQIRRKYHTDSLVLETEFETESGVVALIDGMPPRSKDPDLVRLVVGRRGEVPMRMRLVMRFDYGSIEPWVTRTPSGLRAVAGPDTLVLDTPAPLHGEQQTTVSKFVVRAGETVPFVLTWHESHLPRPQPIDGPKMLTFADEWWQEWVSRCQYQGEWREAVVRSLITLKALTYAPTGGIVAAATTSLPEKLGGVRNWDYRYCWLRDATFTLYALMNNGYVDEARAWREWLLRAVAGNPAQINIMYGLRGERRLTEFELDWLAGYESSSPVRVGNAAYHQFQLDVFGEVMDAMHQARRAGIDGEDAAWNVQRAMLNFLQTHWQEPDEGIWEVRGPRRHFTHSKVMAWVAVDRMIKEVEQFGEPGPVEQWRALRDQIHADVCQQGYNSEKSSFVQYYGADILDASLLMIPLVGFLPPDDPRVTGTVTAIERELKQDGLVARYPTRHEVDGLPPGEGAFLACSFWLADNYTLLGRHAEARELFESLLSLRNDVGLLSEQYEPRLKRLVGNFPQAFSHVGIVNTALNLERTASPAVHRRQS